MDKNDIQELYISRLEKMFSDNIRIIEEDDCISDIILDGEKEDFFISFRYSGRVDVYWNNEMLIFDKGRNLLTSEDTYHEIVYEDLSALSDCKMQANLIIQIITVLNGSTFLSKQKIETGEKTSFGYDTKKQYIINVSKAGEECDKWIFGNIEIRRERGK